MGQFKYKMISAICLSALTLSGCHDGDSENPASPSPTPTVPSSTVTGTAATGRAVVGANVVLTCGGGRTFGAAAPFITTNSSGVFKTSVPTDSLPCAATVRGGSLPAGVTLHSVTTTNGKSIALNITPLSDLVLIKALQRNSVDAAQWLNKPVATNLPNAAAIAAATAELKAALTAKGYTWPTTANFNPITSAISPAVASDIYDALLEALASALSAAASDYPKLVDSFIAGGSFPVAPLPPTPPVTGATCASIGKPKAALTDLAAFVGTYQVKIGSSSTATPLTIAANGDLSLKGQTAKASDICGPFVQANGRGLLILAANTAPVQINVFKDTAGKVTTEGADFSGSSDNFFGEMGTTPVTPPVTPPTTGTAKGILGNVLNSVFAGDYVLQCSTSAVGTPISPVNLTIKSDGSSTMNGQPLVDASHAGINSLEYQRTLTGSLTGVNLKLEQKGGDYALLSWRADGAFVPNSAYVNGQVVMCYSHTGHTAPAASSQAVNTIATIFKPLARDETLSQCLGAAGSANPGKQHLVITAGGGGQFGGGSFTANQVSKVTDNHFLNVSSNGGVLEFADTSNIFSVLTLAVSLDQANKTTSGLTNVSGFLSCTP